MSTQPGQAQHPFESTPPSVAPAEQQVVFLALVQEMRGQRETLEKAQEQAARERKSEHRWRIAFQLLFFGAPIFFGLVYFLFFLSTTGFRWGPLATPLRSCVSKERSPRRSVPRPTISFPFSPKRSRTVPSRLSCCPSTALAVPRSKPNASLRQSTAFARSTPTHRCSDQ
ncbi:S49 family peptidase [Biomphalaria pfeifferi]|uniref:S49 family peptidase n=1 Tax=Biomphalaria pfeifferi TaxID=112525 RepID=A0AAD8ANI9_BIOPF|nr:S49 family peptidase [Biomphalaria pfeifferi]